MMARKLIFCFDGTSNDPDDAAADSHLSGLSVSDSSITNILKLHLLLGGDLGDGQHVAGQRSFYFAGVGTTGSRLCQIFDAALAVPRLTVDAIAESARQVLMEQYQAGDEVFLFGFSRGAAIARRFASKSIPETIPVRFVGVFDTVASIGKPRIEEDGNPASDVVFEHKTISPRIQEALHLISIDETRKVFRPTLMNKDVRRVTELWLAGVHSDVGGGYRVDGMSDSALEIMLEEIDRRHLGLKTIAPSQLPFDQLQTNEKVGIALDDVLIEPDFLGQLHSHQRPTTIAKLTLEPRRVCVNVDDLPSADSPLIHWTVAERIYSDRDYRPKALNSVRHKVLLPDGTVETFQGLADHLSKGIRQLTPLAVGEKRAAFCNSLRLHNHSGILLEQGCRYIFHVPPDQTWRDGSIECGPAGWTRDDVEMGIKEVAIAATEFVRRLPKSNWFSLIGGIGTDDSELFTLLSHTRAADAYVSKNSGELCTFANDLTSKYSNNRGSVHFEIERVG